MEKPNGAFLINNRNRALEGLAFFPTQKMPVYLIDMLF